MATEPLPYRGPLGGGEVKIVPTFVLPAHWAPPLIGGLRPLTCPPCPGHKWRRMGGVRWGGGHEAWPRPGSQGWGAGGGGRDALEGGGAPLPPPLQGAQPMPSHCPPDAKYQLQWPS